MMRWIPISEQLPEMGKDVLFCCLADDEFSRVEVGQYHGGKTHGDAIVMDIELHDWAPCSHWMPIPDPPEPPHSKDST
jgi:hypothetical protein